MTEIENNDIHEDMDETTESDLAGELDVDYEFDENRESELASEPHKQPYWPLILTLLFIVAFGIAYAKVAAPEKDLVLDFKKDEIGSANKTPVGFSHTKHKALNCNACHHKYKEGDAKIKKCSECHKAKKGDVPSLKDAFHLSKNKKTKKPVVISCVGCHKALKKAKKKYGPTSCTKCHPKK